LIRSSLRTYLAQQLAGQVGTRIFPLVLPQSAQRPAITYSRVTGGHDHNLKGSSDGSDNGIYSITLRYRIRHTESIPALS
jgi:hypothetical protein